VPRRVTRLILEESAPIGFRISFPVLLIIAKKTERGLLISTGVRQHYRVTNHAKSSAILQFDDVGIGSALSGSNLESVLNFSKLKFKPSLNRSIKGSTFMKSIGAMAVT